MSTPYPRLPEELEPSIEEEAHWLDDGGHDLPEEVEDEMDLPSFGETGFGKATGRIVLPRFDDRMIVIDVKNELRFPVSPSDESVA